MGTERQCPICRRYFDPEQSSALPFCSDRCRQIDLGRWLGEKYRIAGEQVSPDWTGEEGDLPEKGPNETT